MKRGGKAVGILFGCALGAFGLFVVGKTVFAPAQAPVPLVGVPASTGTPRAMASLSPEAAALREQLVSFLTLAGDPGHPGAERWFPGGAWELDGFTYSPLSPITDPGAGDRFDGTARVHHRELSKADTDTVLRAVSRNGLAIPSTLEITSASRADKDWTLGFKLKAKGGVLVTGQARFTTRDSSDPVILRLTYDN